ncbi:glycoside hydrolase family 15 protein [Fibrisoma montanum]|uniref:Glycoside hydrolase family 15 protein n=1 Tax=Fibrisoma montanum TaxID=2305895 RepID=A0A418MDV5_9BACT|nr:glycoside hydrolase family 15 protein [Fibrisoma montanum]RIV24955.1 glycoside hydrolase family 15 protein [Fibrisoma montanum]
MNEGAYQPIGNYGIIGNLHTIALVSMSGSIDFMCFTRFDSPSLFGAMLDAERGGTFEITPRLDDADTKQLYLPDTTVLVTRFLSEAGVAEITDFMPVKTSERNCVLVRTVSITRGNVPFRMRCMPRFDYARAEHRIEGGPHEIMFTSLSNPKSSFRLMSNVPMTIDGPDVYAEFTLSEVEQAHFVIESSSDDEIRSAEDAIHFYTTTDFEATVDFWKTWIGRSQYTGRWREMVNRSALTLKLLTSFQFGSTVAAPTFGLPSVIGGNRNWDYRFTWIRDAAFTMYAFLRLGFMEEAAAFMHWIEQELDTIDEAGETLQLMYTLDGRRELPEEELDQLSGYRNSAPVRIGNAAYSQFQLDIYGELMDSIYLYDKYHGAVTYAFWKKMERQIEFVCDNWSRPDHGIWEVRSQECEFLQSRLMCWVALDRAIKVVEHRSFPSPIDRWRTSRDEIYRDVYDNFWNEEKQAFVQFKGGNALDASALLMPLVRFIHPHEPRWLSTLEAIERELISDSLVHRYRLDSGAIDGLEGEEGTFTMCSFWYVECLSRAGQLSKARLLFEKMLSYSNHLGLFAEQLGKRGEHLGNFPQAFTHLGLISAAFDLNRRLDSFQSY